ncbi:Inner nuclear membrane protein SRC1 [Candida viswanathii]|uniref:Inner nuclear membrane protein SRC1 n=1 Tax=Candida viswanathii TaxID=5486 RepID=A0A367YJG3_9ASCO|nr:Inner nuclear membrane protein SRC1 [Candida viswanathii]
MDHLKEGFDPSTLTSAQLRNVLNKYSIQYSSSATKSSLVDLFKQEITPNAKRLLSEHTEKLKNSNDDGFVNAPEESKPKKKSSKKSTPKKSTPKKEIEDEEEEEEEEEPAVLEVSKTRTKLKASSTSRKSSSRAKSPEIGVEDDDEKEDVSRPSRSRSNGTTGLNSLFDLDDSVLDSRKTAKRRSKGSKSPESSKKEESKASPVAKIPKEVKEPKGDRTPKKELSSFSRENVFQSSSPAPESSKKRKHVEDEKDSPVRKRVSSSTKKLKLRGTPSTVEKSRFDDDEDSDLELYEKFIKKEDSLRAESSSTIVTPSKLKPTKPRSASSTSKISKPKSSSRKATPSKAIKSSPVVSKDESFRSTEERSLASPDGQVNPEMAKLLGITIQGFQPPVITKPLKEEFVKKVRSQEDESAPPVEKKTPKKTATPRKASSKVTTPRSADKSTPTSERKSTASSARKSTTSTIKRTTPHKRSPLITKSAITPKPRLLSLGSQKYETDDDDEEDESVTEVNLTQTSDADISVGAFKKSSISFGKFIVSLFLWILIVGSGLFGLWYYEQKYSVGYCGQEIDQLTFADSDNAFLETIGKFLDDNFKPQCINCPLHSSCHPNLKLSCKDNFIEYKPWYDVIVPGHKRCIPDTKKAEKLEIMIDVALDLLRSKNAALHCGLGTDDEECGIKLQDLHDLLLAIKAPYISFEEFEELWERSVIEMEKEPDIVVRQKRSSNLQPPEFTFDFNDTETKEKETYKILRSTSLSNISLKCQIHNSIVGGLTQYKFRIISIIALLFAVKFIQIKYRNYQLELAKIDIIYEEVLNKLKTQAKMGQENPEILAYIGSNQLRDLILRNENNLNKRLKIWKQVVDKVEKNSNISHRIIEHHGEIMKVWEWIGII